MAIVIFVINLGSQKNDSDTPLLEIAIYIENLMGPIVYGF